MILSLMNYGYIKLAKSCKNEYACQNENEYQCKTKLKVMLMKLIFNEIKSMCSYSIRACIRVCVNT